MSPGCGYSGSTGCFTSNVKIPCSIACRAADHFIVFPPKIGCPAENALRCKTRYESIGKQRTHTRVAVLHGLVTSGSCNTRAAACLTTKEDGVSCSING